MGNIYKWKYMPSHPLAVITGIVPVHRRVAYDNWGNGPFICRWCSKPIAWRRSDIEERLVVDHVDGNSLNNDISNLVPACQRCNTSRMVVGLNPGEWYELQANGKKLRFGFTKCSHCGIQIKTRMTTAGTPHVVCCSDTCRSRRKALAANYVRGKKFPNRTKLLPEQIWVYFNGGHRRRGVMKACVICSKQFPSAAGKKICSDACRSKFMSQMNAGHRTWKTNPVALLPGELFIQGKNQRSRAEVRICKHCRQTFVCRKVDKKIFCGNRCHYAHARSGELSVAISA